MGTDDGATGGGNDPRGPEDRTEETGGPGDGAPSAAAEVEQALERYARARDQYGLAKVEYKAAKYQLKAARMREAIATGRAGYHDDRRHHHGRHHHDSHHDPYRRDRRRYEKHGYRHGRGEEYLAAPGGGEPSGREEHRRDHRSRRKQVVLDVVATERLGEHFQRITLGGPGFDDYRDNGYTDKYVKILFVDPALGLEPPYDVDALRKSLPKHQRPVRRTYTVHSVDHDARTLTIDFVLHGDSGVAGPWAAQATVGDKVAFSGPSGKYAPSPAADWHLLVGDEAALPAISAALAAMPDDAVGKAFIEVAGPADEWPLTVPQGLEVTWLHRDGEPASGASRPVSGASPLVGAVESAEWPAGRVHAFVHGEKNVVKHLRRHLTEERGVDRRMLSLSSYWTRGKAED